MASLHTIGRDRRIALSIGVLVAVVAGAILWRARPGTRPVEVVDNSFDLQAERTARQLLPRGLSLPAGVPGAAEKFVRREITREEVARVLGLRPSSSMEYDARRFFRYRPSLREVVDFPEHPKRRWIRATNDEGAREDHPFPTPAPELFVLVSGDSHTEGMCDNAETYSNLLELELAKRHPDRRVEVYNTGVSGYSLYSYLGVLEDSRARKPDVFVTTIYGGNDFLEVMKIQHLHAGTVPPPVSYGTWSKFRAAGALSAGALAQCVNQLIAFRENPDQIDVAMKGALFAAGEIQRLCAENGIDWIAVYLPSAFDLPFADVAVLRERIKETLSISEADLGIANRLGDRLLAALNERGVAVIDLRETFRSQLEPLYWSDMHINLRGQALVAATLLPRVDALLAGR